MTRMHIVRLTGLLLIAGFFIACGKTGDLYLPDEKPATPETIKQAPAAKS